MRPVIAVFLVALAQSAFGASLAKSEITPFIFENEIYEIFNCIQVFIEDNFRIVAVDELYLNFDRIEIGDVRGFLRLTNLIVTDPSLISIRDLVGTVTVLPPAFILEGAAIAYDITADTQYEGNLTENELHLWGNGDFRAHVLDISITEIHARYGLLANPPFTDVRGSLSVGTSSGFITGYVDQAETDRVTAIINNLAPWVVENSARINGLIGTYVQAVLNGQYTPGDGNDDDEGPNFWDTIQENCIN